MNYLNYIVGEPLNCGSPFFKCGVEIGAALGIAAAVGSIWSASYGTEQTNAANRRLAQETNAAQEKMMEKQAELSGPVNMRSQFEQAGYSPAAMLGNTPALGLGSAAQAQATNPFPSGSFDRMAQMLFNYQNLSADTAEKRSQVVKTDAESFNLNQQNIYAQQNYLIDTLRNIQALKSQGLDNVAKGLENDLNSKAFQFKLDNYLLQNQMLQAGINKHVADTNLVNINAMCAQEQFKWISPLNNAELQNKLAHLGTEFALQNMYGEQSKLAVQNALESAARTTGQHISNNQLSRASDYIVERMKSERDKAGWDAVSSAYNAYNSFNPDNYNLFKLYQKGGKDLPTEFSNYTGRLLQGLNPFK